MAVVKFALIVLRMWQKGVRVEGGELSEARTNDLEVLLDAFRVLIVSYVREKAKVNKGKRLSSKSPPWSCQSDS